MFQNIFIFLALTTQPAEIDKNALALKALQLIGANVEGASERCSSCHNLDHQEILQWGETAQNLKWCIEGWGDHKPTPAQQIECLKKDGSYSPKKLGLYAGMAHLPKFEKIFQEAYPSNFDAEFNDFKSAVQMPRGNTDNLLAEADAEVISQWIDADMPFLEKLLRAAEDSPTSCSEQTDSRLYDHLERMNRRGWKAQNASTRMPMFACPSFDKPVLCFQQKDSGGSDIFPLSSQFNDTRGWQVKIHPASKMRIIHEAPNASAYWVRSSPDGRFVAMGLRESRNVGEKYYSGAIWDMNAKLNGSLEPREILVNSPFDPQFFPDGSGVNYAGGNFCPMRILKSPKLKTLNFTEPGCIKDRRIGLYQSIGTSLDSTDSLAISGYFSSDYGRTANSNPWSSPNLPNDDHRDSIPFWQARSYLSFFSMVFTGESFEVLDVNKHYTPYDGDWQLSPSTRLLVSRVAGVDGQGKFVQQGYKIHLVNRREDSNDYQTQVVGQFCQPGGKATFSYDERFLTYHHYLDASDFEELGFSSATDPQFQELLKKGASNIYIHDLATGMNRRITMMYPGQYALFPHFRNDNWLYFLVKDGNSKKEFLVATDVALYF